VGNGALSLQWPAPAKLNLFLHVTGRRPDGYHTLQTVFQFLGYCDLLEFEVTAEPAIRRLEPVPGIPEDADLVVRAARRLQGFTDCPQGAAIRLHKRIPLGGGLGGGSSDAATTLVALNHLWQLGLDTRTLAELGLELGADVPVFVRGHAAWAEGVGEDLEPIELDEPWYLVVVPPAAVSTAKVFADPQLTRQSRPITIRDFRAGGVRNDLEPVVRRLYPEVGAALDWLGRFAPARMTGSGACVFARLAGQREGGAILEQLPAGYDGFVARGINRSPLLDMPLSG
jgi:4-diphosphocytidyl-2-C-methyl-D-erythritol kinase